MWTKMGSNHRPADYESDALTCWAIGPNNLNIFMLWSLTTIKIGPYPPSNIYLKSKFRMEEHSIVTIYLNFRAVRLWIKYTYSILTYHIIPISYVQIHSVSRVTCKFVNFTRLSFLLSYLNFGNYHKNHKTIKFDLKQKNSRIHLRIINSNYFPIKKTPYR